jgi:glycosyltransferase involved in cell wall biosynthesis
MTGSGEGENMAAAPVISVVMAVYNGAQYLDEAIASVLGQTYRDFEMIVLDDGSTDDTPEILRSYAARDARIHVVSQANAGFIASLNRGCQLARGQYIARMDPDDISTPDRFTRQVDYLTSHPAVGIVGSWLDFVDEKGNWSSTWRTPVTPGGIRWRLLFENVLGHNVVMMRRDVLERCNYYTPGAVHVEDYDLWIRALYVTEIANIPSPLIRYRIHTASASRQHADVQEQHYLQIVQHNIAELLGETMPLPF